jgi:acylphosphatase
MTDNIRVRAVISGRVQGVYYRLETQRQAALRGVSGWVRNLPDGRVEAVFEGRKDDVEEMISWCRQGPPAAVVKEVAVLEEDYVGESREFAITY